MGVAHAVDQLNDGVEPRPYCVRNAIARGGRVIVGELMALYDSITAAYAHLGRSIHEVLMEHERTPEHRRVVKTGRNDPCPCGSGRKYKKRCGAA